MSYRKTALREESSPLANRSISDPTRQSGFKPKYIFHFARKKERKRKKGTKAQMDGAADGGRRPIQLAAAGPATAHALVSVLSKAKNKVQTRSHGRRIEKRRAVVRIKI